MSFNYTAGFLEKGYTYAAYREAINEQLAKPASDEAAEKMKHYAYKNVLLMDRYDEAYVVSDTLREVLAEAPRTTWLVITEGWCGDAAFNVPMLAALEKAVPEKVRLLLYFRDSNLDLIDANLTDGGRSIPKMVVLSEGLQVLGHWGPRPAGLQLVMKDWKASGLQLKDIILNAHDWYNADATQTLQSELIVLIKNYSSKQLI